MLRFVIPLKSKTVSNNWVVFSKIFERTLKSICNQTEENFQVVVVHHEKPELSFTDERITFLPADFDPPRLGGDQDLNYCLKNQDKSRKILMGTYLNLKEEPSHIMVVDSDDLISNKIARYVNNNNHNKLGWFISKGYFYREGKKFAFYKKKDFNLLCGSCLILGRDHVEKVIVPNPVKPKYPLDYYNHKTVIINGKRLEELPFAGAIYSMANSENIQATSKNVKGIASRIFTLEKLIKILDLMQKYSLRYLSKKVKNNFGFYKILN
ncbi:hypothetical protein [Flagellimonas sp. GZD32]|uniref:hypothetical protein n=1 Tax=Flagellimonas cixiensis TaxID=3228750 RepID=UPI0035C8B283